MQSNTTSPPGPSPVALPAQDDPIVRRLFPQLQQLADTDGSDALTLFGREVVAAAQRYLVAVQTTPDTARDVLTCSPSVRANEHVLQGALRALTVDGIDVDERARIAGIARQAAKLAGLDHLVIASAAGVTG
jgi:hypothetical protein